VKALIL